MKLLGIKALKGILKQTKFGKKLVYTYSLRSYLEKRGWFQSVEQSTPVDKDGNSLPWYTYPMLSFLSERTKIHMDVFEYGSGNSTLWWSKQVSTVTACEHDQQWYDRLRPQMPSNVNYIYCALEPNGQYSKTAISLTSKFDCIVIDGRDRVNCAKNAIQALKPDGVIIWDNSDRESYQIGYTHLKNEGFKRINFWGLGPINNDEWCTSVFYRDNNCFDL